MQEYWAQSIAALLLMLPVAFAAPLTDSHNTTAHILSRRATIPDPPANYDPDKDTWERLISKRCTPTQVAQEAHAWAEAGVMANAMNAWKPASDYQDALSLYMGPDSDYFGWVWDYRTYILANIGREQKIHTGEQPSRTYIYVYCDEDEIPSGWDKNCDGNTGAYTWDSLGFFWSNHMVVLCPNNFFADETPTLGDQLREIKSDPSKASSITNAYWNKASIYFHETFHWKNTITKPRALDSDPDSGADVYGPDLVVSEAKDKQSRGCYVIADCYTLAGTATLLMQLFGLEKAPLPTGALSAQQQSGRLAQGDLVAPKDWADAPQDVNGLFSLPDMDKWQKSVKADINMDDYSLPASTLFSPAPSAATCQYTEGHGVPLADAQNMAHDLGASDETFCTPEIGGCTNVAASGGVAADICSNPDTPLCVNAATVANYVANIITNCQQDGKVGATQDIVEVPGLTVQM